MTAAQAPKPFANITERDLREQIRDLTKVFGWRMAFTQFSMNSPKGFPDLVLLRARDGRLIFAELKSEVGKTKPEQDEWLADLHQFAASIGLVRVVEVYLWRPHDIEAIAEILR